MSILHVPRLVLKVPEAASNTGLLELRKLRVRPVVSVIAFIPILLCLIGDLNVLSVLCLNHVNLILVDNWYFRELLGCCQQLLRPILNNLSALRMFLGRLLRDVELLLDLELNRLLLWWHHRLRAIELFRARRAALH